MAKKKVKKKAKPKRTVVSEKKRVSLAWKNLIFFAALFVVFYALYSVSSNPAWINLFGIFSIVLGVVALAFLVSLLVLIFLKGMKKK